MWVEPSLPRWLGGPPAKLWVTPTELPSCTHLISLLRERMQRVQRWPEHVTHSMKLWRRSV
jgi:hypothetical protein